MRSPLTTVDVIQMNIDMWTGYRLYNETPDSEENQIHREWFLKGYYELRYALMGITGIDPVSVLN